MGRFEDFSPGSQESPETGKETESVLENLRELLGTALNRANSARDDLLRWQRNNADLISRAANGEMNREELKDLLEEASNFADTEYREFERLSEIEGLLQERTGTAGGHRRVLEDWLKQIWEAKKSLEETGSDFRVQLMELERLLQ